MNKIIPLFILIGCTGIKFNPDIYVGDYQNEGITSEKGITVYANEQRFNEYGCMHKSKWKELREILRRARLPRRTKRLIRQALNDSERFLLEPQH